MYCTGPNTSTQTASVCEPVNMASYMLQDADYESSGGKIVDSKDAFGQDIVLKVRPPKLDQEVGHFKDGSRCAPCRSSHVSLQLTFARL